MRKVLFILGELSDLDVEWMTAHGTKQRVAQGANLIREGEAMGAMFIVLDGHFRVWIDSDGQKELARLGSGEILGEISFVDSRPPFASVDAVEDSTVLSIPRSDLDEKLRQDPGFAARFYRAIAVFLSDRLRSTVGRLGYGKAGSMEDEESMGDELDPALLDTVHLAGARFDRMLKKLMGA